MFVYPKHVGLDQEFHSKHMLPKSQNLRRRFLYGIKDCVKDYRLWVLTSFDHFMSSRMNSMCYLLILSYSLRRIFSRQDASLPINAFLMH